MGSVSFNAVSYTSNNGKLIGNFTIPFLIMPGDGAASGCQFSGSAGAFTLSAAILSLSGAGLAGCYAYFSANFGGSALPAGFYWTKFSSDTAGIVYAETYTGGLVKRPLTETPIGTNLTGWNTGTTNEITIPNEFVLAGGTLGLTGYLQIFTRQLGSTTGIKTYRLRTDDGSLSQLFSSTTSGPAMGDSITFVTNIDSHTEKYLGRFNVAIASVGQFGATLMSGYKVSTCDTSIQNKLSFTIQGSTNVAAPILMGAGILAFYGE